MSDLRWRKGRKRGHVLSSTSAVSPAIPLILPFLTKIIEFYWDTSVSFIWFWFIADQSDIPRQIGIPNAMIKILEIFCFCWCWCTWLLNKIIINIQRTEKYSTEMCWCTSMCFVVLRCTSMYFTSVQASPQPLPANKMQIGGIAAASELFLRNPQDLLLNSCKLGDASIFTQNHFDHISINAFQHL